jgi:predicted ATPase/DNA-binding SARP family transcriptional activator
VEFRILGPLEVAGPGGLVRLEAAKQRALLGVLLLHPNEVVSRERLIDELWGPRPPATAAKLVQTYVSQLRRALGPELIATRPPGYQLHIDDDALDAARFRRLTGEARRLAARDEHDQAITLSNEALALWRGPPLADIVLESFARNELERLEEERLATIIERVDCELALGLHEQLIGELEALAAEHPVREGLRGQLMLALYRSGRQADALAAYQEARHTLVEELGLEPSPELQDLEKAILTHDAALQAPLAVRDVKTNLPIQPTPFLGRAGELAEVLALLRRDDVRLLTLTGTGGSGKTRLALEAAAELAGAYEHGVWWVPLAALRDPQLVVASVAQTFGAKDELAREIADKRLLVLLDNFEQVAAAAPGLADLLAACVNLNLLVTSRERLHLAGEHVYSVAPLVEAEAIALFQARASAIFFGFRADGAVAQICRRLDCLPLAVELAAARVNVLPPAALLAHLDDRLALLTGGPRDAPDRQRTLRATIEWSYDLLEPEAQRLFAHLAVFAAGFTLEAAEEICGATFEKIQSLVEKSLLRLEGDRFTMLETIREYVLERLDDADDGEELRTRHVEYFVARAEAADAERRGERQAAALDSLETEQGNMRAALEWSGRRQAPMQLRLAVALCHLWLVRGQLSEGRRWLEESLARTAEQPASLRIEALVRAANFAWLQGEPDRARALAEKALGLGREHGDTKGIASSLRQLANVAHLHGEEARAASLFAESAELYRELGAPWELALSFGSLGEVARAHGDYRQARTFWERALADFKELGDARYTGFALCNLGLIALQQGRSRAALRLLEEGLGLARTLLDRRAAAYALECFAAVAATEREAERAARLTGAADSLLEQIGAASWPSERVLRDRTMAAATAGLGEEKTAATLAEGRSMSLEDAVAHTFRAPKHH